MHRCTTCSKTFDRRYNLIRHQFLMHPSKPKDIFNDGLSSDEDNDEEMDIEETDGKRAWDDLVKPVLKLHKDTLPHGQM